MDLSPCSEAANCAATQEFPNTTWNQAVNYRVHESHPMFPILRQMKPVHTTPSYLSKIDHNVNLPPTARSSSFLFPSDFPINILYAFLFSPFVLYALSIYPPCLDHSNYMWRRVQVMKLLIMQFSPTSCHFIPLLYKYICVSFTMPYNHTEQNDTNAQEAVYETWCLSAGSSFLKSLCRFKKLRDNLK
jgi:hypothetical protein